MAPKKDLLTLPQARKELEVLQQMLGLLPSNELHASLRNAVFVCIDCEAFEFEMTKITEIGVAVLDTQDIKGIHPGEDGANWLAKMKYAHYRPVEYAKFRDKRWTRGCEHAFNYGVTKWVSLEDAPKVLTRLFNNPAQLKKASDFNVAVSDHRRNVALLGHELHSDEDFLSHVGFSVHMDHLVARKFDTARIAHAATKWNVGLHRLLLSLDVEPVNLHNGGNDAAYTLQALILMALRDYQDPGSVFSALATQSRELPDLVYDNREAPYAFAGTINETELDHITKGHVKRASQLPNLEIYRKLKQPSAKAKTKVNKSKSKGSEDGSKSKSATRAAQGATQASQTPTRTKTQRNRDRVRRKKAREAAAHSN